MSRYSEYNLPKLANAISLTKIKNIYKKEGGNYEFHLRNIKVNGQLRGCSGFIVNKDTDKIAYIDTEPALNYEILYRTAEHIKDYTGGTNRYTPLDRLYDNIAYLTA